MTDQEPSLLFVQTCTSGAYDGSTLTLNTGSTVSVRITGSERRVRLTRGEAFFDVAHDPAKPFVVITDHGEVRVLGTSFGVRQMPAYADVSVAEGRA